MPTLPADPIFVSYSRRDDEIMRKIAFFLRDQGFKVWVDNEKLIPGTSAWEEAIENAIKNAFAVVVILSPDSKTSEWVRREITYSDQFQKRVFPVLVKGTEDVSLPLRLVTRQYVDFRKDEEAGLKALLSAITFYVEQKKTLEMDRPSFTHEVVSTPISSSTVSQVQGKRSPLNWVISAGLLFTLCIIGLGMVWAGYRFLSPIIPITGNTPVASTLPSVITEENVENAPTEEVTGSPSNTPAPIPADPDLLIPDLLSQFLDDVQILNINTFEDSAGNGWEIQSGSIENGMMEIVGNDNWDGAWLNREFLSNEGVLIDLSFSPGSTFTVHMDYGSNGTDSYRRFGIYFDNGSPVGDVYEGAEYRWVEPSGGLDFEPEKTYTFLIAILTNGEFLEVIWDPSDPANTLEYRKSFGETYSDLPWVFRIQSPKGRIFFDNFSEIKFSGAK